MTYQIATLVSCVLFPLVGWLAMRLAKRTIYRPITSEEGQQRDEQAERDKVKIMREKSVKKIFSWYGVFVAILFVIAAMREPARKVHAALWPTATPTITNTRTPTTTPTASRTPRPSNTPNANNFLTTISTTGTITTGTVRPSTLKPSGGSGGGGSVTIIQTRLVVQYQTRIVTQVIYLPYTVVVTMTNTPLSLPPSATHTQTVSPTVTSTETHTPTVTYTPTPTFSLTETETPTP